MNTSAHLRKWMAILALFLAPFVTACSSDRTVGSLETGMTMRTVANDPGTGVTQVVSHVRVRSMNPETGELDGPWRDAIINQVGPSNAQVAIAAGATVIGAGVQGLSTVMAARSFSCGGRGCGSGGGNNVFVEGARAGAISGSNSESGAVAGAQTNIVPR